LIELLSTLNAESCILCAAMPTDDVLAIVARADELYRQRARPGVVRESVMVLSGAKRAEERYELQWRLARALFFLGQEARNRADRAQLHHSAIAPGERSISLSHDRVEGHFWTGVNLALFAEARRGLRGARALLWARSELKLAIELREGYHDAGPLRVLGRLEHRAPWILGGNRRTSRDLFDRALEIAPSNSVTLVYAAELAISTGDRERARSLLEGVLELKIDPEWEFEIQRDKALARDLLAGLV
jgi:tetratricopeptide (TPR) repeat protein